jgi:hypothetical protein
VTLDRYSADQPHIEPTRCGTCRKALNALEFAAWWEADTGNLVPECFACAADSQKAPEMERGGVKAVPEAPKPCMDSPKTASGQPARKIEPPIAA